MMFLDKFEKNWKPSKSPVLSENLNFVKTFSGCRTIIEKVTKIFVVF
jgi:hypothetical protein